MRCPQVTTFTDCVNCLIAFTNNPHSLDVSLNAIAFLRFCAMKLAEGAIGARALALAALHGFLRAHFANGWCHCLTSTMFLKCAAILEGND